MLFSKSNEAANAGESVDPALLNAFKGEVNYTLQKDRNKLCVPGTGHWFFHHPAYESFQNGKGSQLLFVTAEAGGGKSTVMRTLADKLLESTENPLVAYFFFKDDDDRLRSYDEALSGLIYQLLTQEPKLAAHVKGIHKKYGDAVKHNTNAIWEALSEIAANTSRDIVCLFDAIDECEAAGRAQLETDVKSFFQDERCATSRLKFVISSRPYQDEHHHTFDLIDPSAKNMRHLSGEDADVQADIRNVIRSKAEDLAAKRELAHDIKEMLVEKVVAQNRHTRSFLAIHMAFELLDSHRRMHKGAGERTINLILADIPNSLSRQFDELLNRSLDPEHTRKLFCIILAARRTIKIEELKVIYALTESMAPGVPPPQSYSDLELPPDDEEFKRLVRSRCGLFITFVKNSVHLFHQTAREHLVARTQASPLDAVSPQSTTSPSGADKQSWKGSITSADADLVFATLCLDIVTFAVPETLPLEAFDSLEAGNHCDDEVAQFASTRPFYLYAALNWHEHVTAAGDRATGLLNSGRYEIMFDISKPQFWAWSLAVADYLCSNTMKKKLPVSTVWTTDKNQWDFARFMIQGCIKKLYSMEDKLCALLDEPIPTPLSSVEQKAITWKASEGFHLIDRFNLAYGEYNSTSVSKAIQAAEKGDSERASLLLAGTPLDTLIWSSIAAGASNVLKDALASSADLSWGQNVPEHIMHRREKRGGWSSRTGEDLRNERAKGWKHPYPATFVVILRAGTLPSSSATFGVLADWVEKQQDSKHFAQQIWEGGGFIIPSLAPRLVSAGAEVESILWHDSRTALQISATFWAHDAVRALLELGADPTKCSANGFNTLHWFSYNEDLYMGDCWGSSDVEKKIFRHNYKKTSIESSIRAIAKAAPDRSSFMNQPCGEGRTPLMHAARSSRSSPLAVQIMLEEGATVDQGDGKQRTALMHFFRGKNFVTRSPLIVKNLLDAGADSCASDASRHNVLSYLVHKITSSELANLYAGFNIFNKTFDALRTTGPLSQESVMVRELKGLKLPLAPVVRLGNAAMCSALLATGASPDKHGIEPESSLSRNSGSVSMDLEDMEWNPLMMALWAKTYVTAAVLIEHGANIKFSLRRQKRTKYNGYRLGRAKGTPLHMAVGSKPESWFSRADIKINAGVSSRDCAFRAAAHEDYPVSAKSGNEMLYLYSIKHYKHPGDQGEEPLDPEYEKIGGQTFLNDGRGAHLGPFDKIEGTPKSSLNPFLAIAMGTNSTPTQRQEALVEYLLSEGISSNARTIDGVTPLAICAGNGLSNLVEILLRYNADPNLADARGCTALLIAANLGHDAVVELLLEAGANPNAQLTASPPVDCKCCAFIDWGSFSHHDCEAPLTALAVAAKRGHKNIVELLLKHGADPNLTIVHHAHGKVPSSRDKRRRYRSGDDSDDESDDAEPEQWKGFISVATALTWARGDVREVLLSHGADPSKEVAMKECDCIIEKKKLRNGMLDSDIELSDNDDASSASSDWEKV